MSIISTDRPTGSSLGELSDLGENLWLGDLTSDVDDSEAEDFDYGLVEHAPRPSVTLLKVAEQTGAHVRIGNPTLADALGQFDRAFAVPPGVAAALRTMRGQAREPAAVLHGALSADVSRELLLAAAQARATATEPSTEAASNAAAVEEQLTVQWTTSRAGLPARSMSVVLSGSTAELLTKILETTVVVTTPTAAELPDDDDPPPHSSVKAVDDAVGLIERLADQLGLPVKDVLAAAGIRPRTFYAWRKPNAPRPRVGSQGQLWQMADSLTELTEQVGGDLRAWLHARPERLTQLRAGHFDELAAASTREQLAANTGEQVRTYRTALDTYGAGNEVGPARPPSSRKRTVDVASVTETTRARRPARDTST